MLTSCQEFETIDLSTKEKNEMFKFIINLFKKQTVETVEVSIPENHVRFQKALKI